MSAAPRDICFVCGHEREGHDAYHARWGDRHAFVAAKEVGTRATDGPRAGGDELGRAAHEAWDRWFQSLNPRMSYPTPPPNPMFLAGWEARSYVQPGIATGMSAVSALSDVEMRRAADEVWVEWSSQWASHELLATSLWTLLQDAVRYGFAAGARRARTTEEGS